MTENIYLVRSETCDRYGDIVESCDLFNTDSYEEAVEYAQNRISSMGLLDREQIVILELESIDGEYDYDGAQLLWISEED